MLKPQDKNIRGLLFAGISSFLVGFGFIFTKLVLRDINPETASVYFFGFGVLGSFLILGARKELKKLNLARIHWRPMLFLGLISGIGALMWFYAIDLIGPSTTAFLMRFLTLFTIMWGILFFKERFNKTEALGMLIAVVGAFVVTYSGGKVVLTGTLMVLVSAFFFSITQLIAKIYVEKMTPLIINHIRISLTFLTLLIYSFSTLKLEAPTLSALIFSGMAGVLVGVVGISLFYKALELTELSKVNIIRTMDPFVVVIYAFLILSETPTLNQLIGGLFIVSGIIILMLARYKPKISLRWLPTPW